MQHCNVSVIIPNKNRARLLTRALHSIGLQTVSPLEVIIIDDGSNEEEIQAIDEAVKKFAGLLNITFIRNEASKGANYCRNIGIYSATSKYIAFLDSDDFWLPEKLSLQMREIERFSETKILCVTGRYRVGTNGAILAIQSSKTPLTEVSIREANFIGPLSSAIVSTSAAREIAGFNEALPSSQDWEFFIRLASNVKYINLHQPLFVYYDHELDRISLNQRRKIEGLKSILDGNLKNQDFLKSGRNTEIYRCLAEAYQQDKNIFNARYYYWRHLSERIRDGKYVKLTHLLKPMPDLKKQRYHRYKSNLSKLLQAKEIQIRTTIDKDFIDSIFSAYRHG